MKIVTLTMNPALDKSSQVKSIRPDSKLRCDPPKYQPGGGGVNVSRAIHKLGGESLCAYLAGGPDGQVMQQLLDEEAVTQHVIPIQNWTRQNFIVVDKSNNQQYRFGMPGAEVFEREWQQTLKDMENLCQKADYIVGSGSLPPGVPQDFWARLAKIAKKNDARYIVDTSGEALELAAEEGVYLLKPNLGELGALSKKESVTALEQEDLAKKLISDNKAEVVVVSMGPQGAMLVSEDEILYVPAPTVHKKSTVGAGDSMVAGMVLSLAQKRSLTEVVSFGVASGTAATMNEGTGLCKKEDTEKLYLWILSKV
ncbi:1-phosphofructokinase family hexose kinase [Catalinimonas niigatensis]|uniref:1-phosphofructokinase family hexose kinase n=1 Tax=Catalinimonas niigatensis TaxID=1397264 RepID=UPI0026659227|nr:1-phosphofructokinase family hexose kinase [Catalinimonas niigatensis]WPP53247.1 1-phosphofructokinase family hexose kinase [Catalinimonas niigatensis]